MDSSEVPEPSETKTDCDSQKSNYSQCYKNNYKTMDLTLQQRRETFLNEHKEKHSLVFDERRDLSELFEEYDCQTDESDMCDVEAMEVDVARPRKKIKFRMTMSEWFTQIPEDLSDNWLFKLCPLGKRRLVISHKGKTKCFNKFGHRLFKFASSLPGGSTRKTQKEGLTVLDCILNENTKTFFILDMLVWNSVSFLECEAELRLCWIRSRYEETPEMFSAYGKDTYQFNVLFDHPADIETIRSEIWQYNSQNEKG
ncbi:snurportin-1 isoform X2 [Coccinella septempunctata]|uniref:snurportin-1 isoform X2 n=1 Tax=Coccinella septempunctata TaxID=41139 RepID=UPI001D06C4E7|nr:snurportin-1 isoform X2 [Coccinella septempunctata]